MFDKRPVKILSVYYSYTADLQVQNRHKHYKLYSLLHFTFTCTNIELRFSEKGEGFTGSTFTRMSKIQCNLEVVSDII